MNDEQPDRLSQPEAWQAWLDALPLDQREFFAAVISEESLHPDLVPYVEESEQFGPMLRHPLVYQVVGINAGLANRAYEEKKKALADFEERKRWYSWVFLHERPYRVRALLELMEAHGEIPIMEFARLAGDVWTDSENIHQMQDEWEAVFDALSSTYIPDGGRRIPDWVRRGVMVEEDLPTFEALAETLTVYRGFKTGLNESGLSWTLEKKVAVWFAKRFAEIFPDNPPGVFTGVVDKDDVIAYFDAGHRGEKEIVVANSFKVTVTDREEVTREKGAGDR